MVCELGSQLRPSHDYLEDRHPKQTVTSFSTSFIHYCIVVAIRLRERHTVRTIDLAFQI